MPPEQYEPDFLTSAQVAEMTGKSIRTIHRMVLDGRITPAVTAPGYRGPHLFTQREVDRFVASLRESQEVA